MSCHETDTSMSAWSVGKFAKRSATLHISSEDSKYTVKVCQSSNGSGALDNLSVLIYDPASRRVVITKGVKLDNLVERLALPHEISSPEVLVLRSGRSNVSPGTRLP